MLGAVEKMFGKLFGEKFIDDVSWERVAVCDKNNTSKLSLQYHFSSIPSLRVNVGPHVHNMIYGKIHYDGVESVTLCIKVWKSTFNNEELCLVLAADMIDLIIFLLQCIRHLNAHCSKTNRLGVVTMMIGVWVNFFGCHYPYRVWYE